MKIVVISGASGFIGGVLAEHLLQNGITVYGVGRDFQKIKRLLSFKTFIPIELDFKDYSHLKDVIPQENIDVFYHFAWSGGFERNCLKNFNLQLRNVQASCDAMMEAIELRVNKFVYAGTINEIEIQQFINRFATFETRPTCIYASAKLAAELICRTMAQENHIHYNSGLIPMIYGKGNRSNQLVNVVLRNLILGIPPKLIEGNNQYDLVHVDDVARAFEAIGNAGINGKRYYVGHRTLKTFREWMEELRDIVSPNTDLHFNEYNDPLNLDYSLLNLDALYQDTGFECKESFYQRMKENAEWFQAEGL